MQTALTVAQDDDGPSLRALRDVAEGPDHIRKGQIVGLRAVALLVEDGG